MKFRFVWHSSESLFAIVNNLFLFLPALFPFLFIPNPFCLFPPPGKHRPRPELTSRRSLPSCRTRTRSRGRSTSRSWNGTSSTRTGSYQTTTRRTPLEYVSSLSDDEGTLMSLDAALFFFWLFLRCFSPADNYPLFRSLRQQMPFSTLLPVMGVRLIQRKIPLWQRHPMDILRRYLSRSRSRSSRSISRSSGLRRTSMVAIVLSLG